MTTAPLAIVTGGKRRLGAEIAAKLAGAGYALALVSHMDAPPTDALAAALDAHQSAWHAFTFDLSTGNPAELIDAIASHFGLRVMRWITSARALQYRFFKQGDL